MKTASLLFIFSVMLFLASCGEKRRFGDVDGKPVTIAVDLERAFVKSMENRQARPSVGAGVGFGSGGYSGVGVGMGLSFSSTQVYLVGGDNVGQANVFRKEIGWGENSFSVPLTPGRTIHMSVHVEGGRRGWEAIEPVVIPMNDAVVSISLTKDGSQVSLSDSSKSETTTSANEQDTKQKETPSIKSDD